MGMPTFTPEQLLKIFQDWTHETADPQFSEGIPIIRAWMILYPKPSVSQAEFDDLICKFETTQDAGSWLYDLWRHVVFWGRELGLTVPDRNPWARR